MQLDNVESLKTSEHYKVRLLGSRTQRILKEALLIVHVPGDYAVSLRSGHFYLRGFGKMGLKHS